MKQEGAYLVYDELSTMDTYASQLENSAIHDWEEGFIRGYNVA